MPLGGFAPLPLRLGGTAIDGLTPDQHARLAADLVAMVRAAPFACIGLTTNSTAVGSYIAQHGVGAAAAPTIASGVGYVRATWSDGYLDDYEVAQATRIRHAVATPQVATACFVSVTIDSVKQVTVRCFSHAGVAQNGVPIFLVVW